MADAAKARMTTLAHHHHHTTPLRIMDFVVLAIVAFALAFVAQSDNPPEPSHSGYSAAP